MARIGFVGPTYALNDVDAAAQRCVNLFPQVIEVGNEPQKIILRGTPGLAAFATAYSGQPVRGMIDIGDGRMLVVAGQYVRTIGTDGTVTAIGTLISTSGVVNMASNGQEIMLVDGAYGYYFTIATDTLTQIADADFPGGYVVVFLDGYFLVSDPDTQNIYISGLYDPSTWDPLDFGAAEGNPDNIISLCDLNQQVWAFGTRTVEPFYNSGNADFPFTRVSGGLIEKGCGAKYSVAKCDNSVFWLSDQRVVYRNVGYQAARISTHPIEEAIARYTVISDAIGMSYEQEGHAFYVLTFPTEGATWVYDASTQMWHERGEWVGSGDGDFDYDRWRPSCVCYFNDGVYAGDYENGRVYRIDLDSYTDNLATIRRMRRTPHARGKAFERLFHRALTLTMTTGVVETSAGTYPLSDDGTLAAAYGYGHIEATAPDYLVAPYEYSGVAAGGTAFALPSTNNAFVSQAINCPTGTIVCCEAVINSLSATQFDGLGIACAFSNDGAPTGGVVTAYISDTNGATPRWNGTGISAQVRTSPAAGFRVGLEFNGTTGAIRIITTDGTLTSSTTFTPGTSLTFYLFVTDSGTTPAGETCELELVPAIADMDLTYATGAQGPADLRDMTVTPQAMLRWSNDGGHTWGNEIWREFGRLGEYAKKVDWHRLGMARTRVYELSITDAARICIMDDDLDVKAGMS